VTELVKIPIPKERFCQIQKEERVLFVLLGHIANELTVLGKLLRWCGNATQASPAETDARVMQTLFLAKLLAGKLNEGWEAFRRGFFETGLSRTFEALNEEPHRGHLQELKRYFNGENLLRKVRHKFSFHYSLDEIQGNVELVASRPDELVVYLDRSNANCLYAACDLISNFALLQAVAPDDPAKAIATFLEDLDKMSRLFLSVISGCIWAIISRHLGEDLDALKAEKVNVDVFHDGRHFAIPYFSLAGDSGAGAA